VKLSKESECGLNGVVALAALPPGTIRSVAELAAATGLSRPFLAKVFQRLARGGVLRAQRGRSQGYALARPPGAISAREVLEAIEGPQLFGHCAFWSSPCSEEHPCVLHAIWREAAARERELLAGTSVAELARRRGNA
jgi:Rrf2 family protein